MTDNDDQQFKTFCEFANGHLLSIPGGQQYNHLKKMCGSGDILANYLTTQKDGIIQRIAELKAALIVVDFQNDFVDGSLSIKNGPAKQDPKEAVGPLNKLLQKHEEFTEIIFTMEWHPENHISFFANREDKDRKLASEDAQREIQIGESVQFDKPNLKVALYPAHCVENTEGAEIYKELIKVEKAKYVQKGTQTYSEAYSGFEDNQGENKTELEQWLQKSRIDVVFVCGLALDICVRWTARSAANLGLLTAVIEDCSKGLDAQKIEETKQEMAGLDAAVISSADVEQFLDKRKIPWQWLGPIMKREDVKK